MDSKHVNDTYNREHELKVVLMLDNLSLILYSYHTSGHYKPLTENQELSHQCSSVLLPMDLVLDTF